MSKLNLQGSSAYYIYNTHINDFIRYNLLTVDPWGNRERIIQIFNERTVNQIQQQTDFTLDAVHLIELRDKLSALIKEMLVSRKPISGGLVTLETCVIFEETITLNTRNHLDGLIFWYQSILHLVEDSIYFNYPLHFTLDRGQGLPAGKQWPVV